MGRSGQLIVNDKGCATPLQDPEFGLGNVVFPLSQKSTCSCWSVPRG